MEFLFKLSGPLMLVAGVLLFFRRKEFMKKSTVINGTVTEIRTRPARNNKTAYYPVIKYYDTANSRDEFYESANPYSATKYKIGDLVELRYLKDGVRTKLCMNNWFGIWGLSFMLVLFGILFCVLEVILLF